MSNDDFVIGASVTPKLLGLNTRVTPLRAQQELLGTIDRENAGKGAEVGTRLERTVLATLVEDHDVEILSGRVDPCGRDLRVIDPTAEIRTTGLSMRHPQIRWMAASADGVIPPTGMSHRFIERFSVDVNGGEHIVTEAKTTGFASEMFASQLKEAGWGRALTDAVPRAYLVQVHQQIEVVDAALRMSGKGYCDRAILRVLGPGLPLVDYLIVRIPTVVEFIVTEIGQIVSENLIGRAPLPAKTVDDYDVLADAVAKVGRNKTRRPATLDEEIVVAEWIKAKEDEAAAKLIAAEKRAWLIERIGDGWGLETSAGNVTYTMPREEPRPRQVENAEAIVADLKNLIATLIAPGANDLMRASAATLGGIIARNTHEETPNAHRRLTAPRKDKEE